MGAAFPSPPPHAGEDGWGAAFAAAEAAAEPGGGVPGLRGGGRDVSWNVMFCHGPRRRGVKKAGRPGAARPSVPVRGTA